MAKKKTTNASKAAPAELAISDCAKHVLRVAISTGANPRTYLAETILLNYVPVEQLTAVVKLTADGLQIERTYVAFRTGSLPQILVLLGEYMPETLVEVASIQGVAIAVEVMAEAADVLPFALQREVPTEELIAAAVQRGITAWENSSAEAADSGAYEEVIDAEEESSSSPTDPDAEAGDAPFDTDDAVEETETEETDDLETEEEYEESDTEDTDIEEGEDTDTEDSDDTDTEESEYEESEDLESEDGDEYETVEVDVDEDGNEIEPESDEDETEYETVEVDEDGNEYETVEVEVDEDGNEIDSDEYETVEVDVDEDGNEIDPDEYETVEVDEESEESEELEESDDLDADYEDDGELDESGEDDDQQAMIDTISKLTAPKDIIRYAELAGIASNIIDKLKAKPEKLRDYTIKDLLKRKD